MTRSGLTALSPNSIVLINKAGKSQDFKSNIAYELTIDTLMYKTSKNIEKFSY